jgi:hypothetical protein
MSMPANTMFLDDVVAKFRRAEEHFDTVKGEIRLWQQGHPYRIVKKVNAEATRHTIAVRIRTHPPLQKWSTIVSDCMHNLRACLDYLVYAVAIEHTRKNPPPNARSLQFPICDSPDLFVKASKRYLPTDSISPKISGIIESLQPYKRPYPGLPPILAILRDFDDVDKHRLLHVMLSNAQQWKFENVRDFPPDATPTVEVHTVEVVDKAELATIVFDRPAPDTKFKFIGEFVIAIPHAPGPSRVPWSEVGAVLTRVMPEVRYIIDCVLDGMA